MMLKKHKVLIGSNKYLCLNKISINTFFLRKMGIKVYAEKDFKGQEKDLGKKNFKN